MSQYQFRVSRPTREFALGKEWIFSRFTIDVWHELAVYGRKVLPHPARELAALHADAVLIDAETIRQLRIKDAEEEKRAKAEGREPVLMTGQYQSLTFTLWEKALAWSTRYLEAGSPELAGLYRSPEGGAQLFYLLLKPNHPEVTHELAYDVYMDLRLNNGQDGRKTIEQIRDICNGTAPESVKNADSPEA